MPGPQRQGGQRPPQQPQQAVQRVEPDTRQQALVAVTREIDNRMGIVAASAAVGITPERLKGVALSAFTRTPALWTCDPVSVARAIVEAGQLGLEPTGLMGGAYLVPRGNQCTLLIGYRGLVMLARRSGEIARVVAQVVYERDEFAYEYGGNQYLRHVPSREVNRGNVTDVWAMAYFRDGGYQFDVMPYDEVELIRKRSSSPLAGPWVTDWGEMAKKTVLRRLCKLLPMTVDVAAALDEIDPEVVVQGPAVSTAPTSRQASLREQAQRRLLGAGGESFGEAPVVALAQQPAADRGNAPRQPAQDGPQGDEPPPPANAEAAAPAAQQRPSTAPTQPAATQAATAAPVAVGAMVACDVPSPYDDGATRCGLPRGHQTRNHRGEDGSTWQ